MGRGLHSDGLPTGFEGVGRAAVGKLRLPHYLLAAASTVVTLALSAFLGIGGTGPAGAPGTTTIITKTGQVGLCAYFGPDKNGRTRFQVSAPNQDANGLWCPKGYLVDLEPKKK